jgi:hypothetical protein
LDQAIMTLAEAASPRPANRLRPGMASSSACIGVPRRPEHRLRLALLHDLAMSHHHDTIGDLGGDPQVMGDEEHCEIHFLAQFRQQCKDVWLHRDVKRRDRFVRYQHHRL